tara:strand:- start:383 stop:631 length:249 start_codon:yes stop_codon:yes gene_type:complete
MNPSLNSSDLQGLSDIWKNITHPTEDQPEATPPETPEASVDSEVEKPEVPEVEDNDIKDKLQSSGHFTDAELERIVQADKWR